jgi:hypothetical protein
MSSKVAPDALSAHGAHGVPDVSSTSFVEKIKNNPKIVGSVIVIVIIVIGAIVTAVLLTRKPLPSTPIIWNGNHTIESKIELYPETDYKKGDESAAYPSYIEITNIKEKTSYDNILVKSLKVKNCKITLFTENNYTGKTMIIDKYNGNDSRFEPLLEGFKSVTIQPYNLNEYELFSVCDFKEEVKQIFINDKFNYDKMIEDKIIEDKINAAKRKGYSNILNELKIDNTYINSVRSYGLILTLYSNPDFTGKETILSDDIIYIACLPEQARSIKIKPKPKI